MAAAENGRKLEEKRKERRRKDNRQKLSTLHCYQLSTIIASQFSLAKKQKQQKKKFSSCLQLSEVVVVADSYLPFLLFLLSIAEIFALTRTPSARRLESGVLLRYFWAAVPLLGKRLANKVLPGGRDDKEEVVMMPTSFSESRLFW